MKRKHLFITFLTILIVLFTAGIGILTSYVSNFVSPVFKPYALPLLVIIILVISFLTVLLYFLQAGFDRPASASGSQARQWMLAKVDSFWIKGILEQSLHQAPIVVLNLQEQPDAIVNPWQSAMQETKRLSHLLTPGTQIIHVYDNSVGELLILGEPGSGKTTLLLELTSVLLDRAQKNEEHPIPIVFHLSSWSKKQQDLADWLVEELHSKYNVPRNLGREWVETDQVIPLLDGLDEIDIKYQEACIGKINRYRQERGLVPLIVCSRSSEYLAQKKRLLLLKAIVIQPLTTQQIDDYLGSAGEQLEALRLILQKDSALQELASIPLMLSVLTLVYRGKPTENVLTEDTVETQLEAISDSFEAHFGKKVARKRTISVEQQRVFEAYVHHMLHRRGSSKRYSPHQIIHWLSWLAQRKYEINKTMFSRPSDTWLPPGWSLNFYLWFNRGCNLGSRAILFLWLSLLTMLIFQLLNPLSIIIWFIMAIASLYFYTSIAKYRSAEGFIRNVISTRNEFILSLTSFIFSIGIILLVPQRWLILFLITLLNPISFILWLVLELAIDHFKFIVVRILLCLTGCIPWNYQQFLDFAVERILLHKVGHDYIFIHHLMSDYFSSLEA